VITAWRYVSGIDGRTSVDPLHIGSALDPQGSVVWIDCVSPTADDLQQLRRQLGLSDFVVDALVDPEQTTKLVRYGDYFHVAVHDCELGAEVRLEQREVDVVMGPGWLVTVRHPSQARHALDVDRIAHHFELQRSEHGATEEGFLLWALFDVIIDRYLAVVDTIDERLDTVEDSVFDATARMQAKVQRGAFELRRELVDFRRAAAPMREVLFAITRKELPFVSDDALVHFRDLSDRMLRVLDFVETQRDLLAGLLEADLAVISNRINEVMKKTTSWGAILIVATLFASIYGMNFSNLPALDWEYGYVFALVLIAVVTLLLYRTFKRRDWL
jgi:magnesium transporter